MKIGKKDFICINNDNIKLDFNKKKIYSNMQTLKKKIRLDAVINYIDDKIKERENDLNMNHEYSLMGLHDSWSKINHIYRIELCGNWWYIFDIISHITCQLNNSLMENPYPNFPSNPFNRKIFTYNDIIKLKKRIKLIGIKINIALKYFFDINKSKFIEISEESRNHHNGYSKLLLNIFNENMRYKLINYQDSQNCFVGYWTNSNENISSFEFLYNKWSSCHLQIIVNNRIQDNPEKNILYKKMIKCKTDAWSPLITNLCRL